LEFTPTGTNPQTWSVRIRLHLGAFTVGIFVNPNFSWQNSLITGGVYLSGGMGGFNNPFASWVLEPATYGDLPGSFCLPGR
jgi:hypothetical protein